MILAAGVGSRLDPLTRNVPKPMVPVVNQPVMEHIVRLLVQHGFTDIIANTHYLADQIEYYFNDGKSLGANMSFNREEKLMGTAGGLKRVAEQYGFFDTDEPFLVVGGDDLTSIDLTKMVEFHKAKGALSTIALTTVSDPSQFGVVVLEDEKIKRFVEKPAPGTAPSNLVNMGVYLFQPEILKYIPSGEFWDFGKNVFPDIQQAGEPFYGYECHEYWRDVGNLREYREVHDDFFDKLVDLNVNVADHNDGVYVGEGACIDATAEIEGPVIIGAGSIIKAHAKITSHSVLGEGVVIGEGATVERSILWARSEVAPGTHISKCIVGFDCSVSSNAAIFGGTIVQPQTNGK